MMKGVLMEKLSDEAQDGDQSSSPVLWLPSAKKLQSTTDGLINNNDTDLLCKINK